MTSHDVNFADMFDLAYRNQYPVISYSPGNGMSGRIYWPNTSNGFPKRMVLKDGDSLQHAFLYISTVGIRP